MRNVQGTFETRKRSFMSTFTLSFIIKLFKVDDKKNLQVVAKFITIVVKQINVN